MKNILFIAHSGKGGGAESVLAYTINNTYSDTNKYKRFVVYPKFQGEEFKNLIERCVNKRSIFFRSNSSDIFKSIICTLYNIPALLYLIVFCLVKRIDIIYLNSSVNFAGAVLAVLTSTKTIWHIHEQPNKYARIIPNYMRPIYRVFFLSTKFNLVFVSKHSRDLWGKALDLKNINGSIIYPPVKKLHFSGSELGRKGEFYFGYMGALVKEKNILFLIEVFSELVKSRPKSKISLVIAGEGILLGEILKKCKILEITNSVIIQNYNKDVAHFFSKIDALVQPSYNESWGLVALEAMSFCKAVIMTKESGLKEILDDGSDCLFINPLDKNDLLEKMLYLIDYKEACNTIAQSGYSKYKSFDFNNKFNFAIQSITSK